MSLLPHYIHIVNPKLKHIYLTFNDQGELVIKSPKVSQKEIENLLLKKASWINKAKKKLHLKKGKYPSFVHNDELYFLGEAHVLKYIQHTKKKIALTFDGDTFTLYADHYDKSKLYKKIDAFYKKESENYIPSVLQKWSDIMNLSVTKLSFRKTKRQWGSCSSDNKISINTMIMKLPLDVIEYIIVHELSHIPHKHHQKAFWKHVERYMPEYKTQVNKLKEYTP